MYLFIRDNNKLDFLPLTLIAFGILILLTIAVGRVGFGVGQGMASRYTTYALCIVIGICLFIYNGRLALWSNRTVIAIVFMLYLASQVSSLPTARLNRDFYSENKAVFVNYRDSTDDEMRRLGMDPDGAREFAALMEQHGAGPFRGMEVSDD